MSLQFQAQSGADGLVPHAHRFEIAGGPRPMVFPPLCPNCGSPADRTVKVAKVFCGSSGDDWQSQRHVQHMQVPFCASCVASHEAQVWRPNLFDKLLSLAGENLLAALGSGAAALFLVTIMPALRGHKRFDLWSLFLLGLFGLFALISWTMARSAWRGSEHKRTPAQTAVSSAFDFSDDVSKPFEPPRVVCTMRDARFAAAFEALNPGAGWDPSGPVAATAERKNRRLIWVGLAALLAFALWDLVAGGRR